LHKEYGFVGFVRSLSRELT